MSRLVLVDDDNDQLELMRMALHALGTKHSISTFCSGEACLAALERISEPPALIVLDVNMPGLDGPATVVHIRRLPGASLVPVVMLSTSDQRNDVRRARVAGADGYVTKPRLQQTWRDVMASLTTYWLETDLIGQN